MGGKYFAAILAVLLLLGCVVMEEEQRIEVPEEPAPPAEGPEAAGEGETMGEGAGGGAPGEESPPGEEIEGEGAAPPEEEIPEEEELGTLMGEENVTVEKTDIGDGKTEREYFGMGFGEYILLLEDLSDEKPYPCAIVRVVDFEGVEYERTKICPGDSYYWISPEGHRYRFYVVQTAAGYSGGAAWADIIVYT